MILILMIHHGTHGIHGRKIGPREDKSPVFSGKNLFVTMILILMINHGTHGIHGKIEQKRR